MKVIEQAIRVVPNKKGQYNHVFGGAPDIDGLFLPKSEEPLHILYNLDLNDPALKFLGIPKIKRFPLVYPFRYEGADLFYKVKSDKEIEIFNSKALKPLDDWPYPNYPSYFEAVPVDIEVIPYEIHKTLAFAYALTSDFLFPERLEQRDRNLIEELGYPFTQIGGVQNLPYGEPIVHCPNTKCSYHDLVGSMEVIATVHNFPLPELSLWGEYGTTVIIVYKMCSECKSIYVCNTCD